MTHNPIYPGYIWRQAVDLPTASRGRRCCLGGW